MPEALADVVIQISASEERVDTNVQAGRETGGFDAELRSRLKPGLQIALAYPGYRAIAAVLWISNGGPVPVLRAGLRLIAVSACSD